LKNAIGLGEIATKDLRERTIRGGFAKICYQGTNFLVRVGSLMVLGRLLDPKDFGLVGMVTAVIGVLNLFKDFGLSTATVQRATITQQQLSALFWVNVAVGAILAILCLAIAPVLAVFYHDPRIAWVTSVMAAGFLVNGAAVQHSALLQRQLRFTALAVLDTVSLLASTAVGICMAMSGCGYWALVGMTVTTPLISTICVWLATAWVPGRPSRHAGVRSMMRFGSTATLNSLITYVAYNFEKVLLGRFWGAESLGLYGRAYQLINIPTDNLNAATANVAFAALSRLQDDPIRLKSYFLKGYSVFLALTLPITVACVLFADDLIFMVLGPKWNDAVTIFRLLAPATLVFAVINPLGWFLVSIGMIGRSLKIALVIAPLVIAAYLVGLPHGPKGVAFAYSAAMTLWVIPHVAWSIHSTVISFQDILRTVAPPLLSGLVSAALAFAVRLSCEPLASPLLRLLLSSFVFLIAYLGMLLYVMGEKSSYTALLRVLRTPFSETREQSSLRRGEV
jgi:O-antigen/teichoic acid export membrane protein